MRNQYYPHTLRTETISPELVHRNRGWMSISTPALKQKVNYWLRNPNRNLGIKLSARHYPNLIANGLHADEFGYVSTNSSF